MMYEKIILFIFICFVFTSCCSTGILPNNGTGTNEYRELESEIRTGETDLAITGKELEFTNSQLEKSISSLESTGSDLESAITESTDSEPEIGEILQSVRNRPFNDDDFTGNGFKKDNRKAE